MKLYGIKKADGSIEPGYLKWTSADAGMDCEVGDSVVPVQIIEALPPIALRFRVEPACPKCQEPEDDVACIVTDHDVCVGRFTLALAEAMVARLNLPGGDAT